ncbi:hypothetical protein Rwratislav_36657 [Rhodococcus wratislaviensis IFP 2016]|nr:hypothetical protein Rwratislav_36657 [Rhodococcus wratislaviensis IFP 2016]
MYMLVSAAPTVNRAGTVDSRKPFTSHSSPVATSSHPRLSCGRWLLATGPAATRDRQYGGHQGGRTLRAKTHRVPPASPDSSRNTGSILVGIPIRHHHHRVG